VNVFDDLRQLSLNKVKALEYGRYDINKYRFGMVKLEASCSLAATRNSGLVADYYGAPQNILEYTFGGTRELKVVFFECVWFDPVNDTRSWVRSIVYYTQVWLQQMANE
jgi:hypothetical protein